jgi:predicted alpha/beta superfamily hydrolase
MFRSSKQTNPETNMAHITHETMAEIAEMEKRAFCAAVLAPRKMKGRAKKVHAQWASALNTAMQAMPVDPVIAAMSDNELLEALGADYL